jgi:subtilisin family serine protease
LGQYIQDDADWEYYQGLINRMAGDKVVFVASSGNGGPGIASLSTPGDVENIISVGAYMAPELLAWIMERKSGVMVYGPSVPMAPAQMEAGNGLDCTCCYGVLLS